MKQTIKPDDESRSIPKCIYDFLGRLENLTGVEEVRASEFLTRRQSRGFQAQKQYYDGTSRILRIKVQYRQFTAFFNLRINPDLRQEIEQYIAGYCPNRRNNGSQ